MRHCRYLVSDAHVWPAVVVEVDVALDDTVGMLIGVESRAVDTFHLYYTVGALRNGIVRRLVVLAHGYGLVDGHLQSLHRDGGLERVGQCPSHDLVRVGIGDEVQVKMR